MGVYVSLNISILVKLSFHNILNHIGPVIVSECGRSWVGALVGSNQRL
jgi:hypothetical protein